MRLLALCLTKHKKSTEIIQFQCLFIFDDFGMKTNFKSIFHKEQYCRGDHSDSNECIFFVFYFKFSRNKLILKKDIFLNVKYSLKLKKKLFKKKKFWLNVILKENRKKKNGVIIFFL